MHERTSVQQAPTGATTPKQHKNGGLSGLFRRRDDKTTPATPPVTRKGALGKAAAWLRQSLSRDSIENDHCDEAPRTSAPNRTDTGAAAKQNAPTLMSRPFGSFVARLSGRRQQPKGNRLRPELAVVALDKRETMSEEDLVSKSLSHECTLIANGGDNNHVPMAGSLMQSAYSEESVCTSSRKESAGLSSRAPSYVRISCALSGYRTRSQPSLLQGTPLRTAPMIYDAHFSNPPQPAPYTPDTSRYGKQPISAPAPGKSNVERRRDVFERKNVQSATVAKLQDEILESGRGNVKAIVAELSTGDDRRQRPTARPPPVPQRTVGPLSVVSESSATTRSVAYGADSPDAISSMHDDAVPVTNAETPSSLTNGCSHSGSNNSQQTSKAIIAIFDSYKPPPGHSVCDGQAFANEARILRDTIERQCDQLDHMLDTELDNRGDKITEDGAGQIRIAAGKARLLIKKKLAKFDQLVASHLSGEETATPTLLDDLRGFWDLMLIDVDDVRQCMLAIARWQANNWRAPQVAGTRSPATARATTKTPTSTPRVALSARADDARRRRLADAIATARANKNQQNDDVDIIA